MKRKDIETERLILTPSKDDRDLAIYKAHLESCDPEEFLFQYGEERSEEFMELIDFHSAPVKYYTVFEKESREMVGYVGLANPGKYGCELEFHIFEEYRRKHYAYEACAAVLREFWEGRILADCGRCVVADAMSRNEACCSFLEKLGFKKKHWGMRISLNDEGELGRGLSINHYEMVA